MHYCNPFWLQFQMSLTQWRHQGRNLTFLTRIDQMSFSFLSVPWSLTIFPQNRTASTLEAFEQHLMSYRGIHKHCDTCRQILDQGHEVKSASNCGWNHVPQSWIRRTMRSSQGGKSKEAESRLPLLCSRPLHLHPLLTPRSQRERREQVQTRLTGG